MLRSAGAGEANAVSRAPLQKFDAWASKNLSAAEAGMLYALHPQLIAPRHAAAHRRARRARRTEAAGPRFEGTLAIFASACARLDEFTASLPEDEQHAFTLALLGDTDAPSLLRHLLAAS